MTHEPTHDLDVSMAPEVVFDAKSLIWWGTLGFIVIEGFTILLTVGAYFYLRLNQLEWPPAPIPEPDLLIPTINTLLLLLLIVPMHRADAAARRYDRRGVIVMLVVTTLLTVPAIVLRWFELTALNVRWDSTAYGSIAWALVVLHGTLLLFDLFETGALAFLFLSGQAQRLHYPDVSDAAMYQYYLSLIWVPLYLIVYWGPRFL